MFGQKGSGRRQDDQGENKGADEWHEMQFDNLYTAERFMSTLWDNKIKSAGVARKNQVDKSILIGGAKTVEKLAQAKDKTLQFMQYKTVINSLRLYCFRSIGCAHSPRYRKCDLRGAFTCLINQGKNRKNKKKEIQDLVNIKSTGGSSTI